jgi:hypothetical protein
METKVRKEIKSRNRSTQAHFCLLEVRRSGMVVGHIRRGEREFFQYHRGTENFVRYEFDDADLLQLKKRIVLQESSPRSAVINQSLERYNRP